MVRETKPAGLFTLPLMAMAISVSVMLVAQAVLAVPNFHAVFDPVTVALHSSVQLQGGVANYDEECLEDIHAALAQAVKTVASLAPAWLPRHYFAAPTEEATEKRRLVIVLTDAKKIKIASGDELELAGDSGTYAPIFTDPNGTSQQIFYLPIRVDQILFLRNGEFRSDAYASLLVGLLIQSYGDGGFLLEKPISAFKNLSETEVNALQLEIIRREIRVLEENLRSPVADLIEGAGPVRAKIFTTLMHYQDELRKRTGQWIGPWRFKYGVGPGTQTLNSVSEALQIESQNTICWALSLVHRLPPPNLPFTVFHASEEQKSRWADLTLFTSWMDLRYPEARIPYPVRQADHLDWVKAEMVTSRVNGKLTFHHTVWTNRAIHDDQLNLRPDRLAGVAMSIAGDYYGRIQPYLADPDRVPNTTHYGLLRRSADALRESIAFADRLMENQFLWGQLDDEQKQGFVTVRKTFAEKLANAEVSCMKLLEEAPGFSDLHGPEILAELQKVRGNRPPSKPSTPRKPGKISGLKPPSQRKR